MPFHPDAYGPDVAAILAEHRVIPLVQGGDGSDAGRAAVRGAAVPELARAGLYLYSGCWASAHEIAQSIDDPDGAYWHAIVHRQEPDAGNSSYWFGQTGRHTIFPALAEAAAAIEPALAGAWDPYRFIEYCERARREPGSETERRALQIQRIEWELLFDYSFRTATRG
jgi:hypothetical protein